MCVRKLRLQGHGRRHLTQTLARQTLYTLPVESQEHRELLEGPNPLALYGFAPPRIAAFHAVRHGAKGVPLVNAERVLNAFRSKSVTLCSEGGGQLLGRTIPSTRSGQSSFTLPH